MAINIQSLFADIIDTPEQRQQKLLQQGMVQGQLLSSGLRGRAAALAPLAQMAGQLGVQRQEDLRRAVQPMIGIDPRSTGEKLQSVLASVDTSTPAGMLQAANLVQSIDPVRAAALRQEAARMRTAEEDRELTRRTQEASLRASGLQEASAALQISERGQAVIDRQNYREGLPTLAQAVRDLGSEYEAIAVGIESSTLDPKEAMRDVASIQSAKFKATPKDEFKPILERERDDYLALAKERPELNALLKKGFFGGKPDVSEAKFFELAGKFRSMPEHKNKTPSEIIDLVQASITTGTGADLLEVSVEDMAQRQAGGAGFDAEAAAAAAAAQLGITPQPTEAPEANIGVDPNFEATLRNVAAANGNIEQAKTRYINQAKARITNLNAAIRNREATNTNADDLRQQISQLEARIANYSQ